MQKIYLQNGLIINDIKSVDNEFFIMRYGDSFYFKGYEELSNIELNIRGFFQNILHLIYPNIDDYYSKLSSIPNKIITAGLDSDSDIDKETFSKEILKIKDYRLLYYEDLTSLLSSVADRILFMKKSFIDFYINFCEIKIPNFEKKKNYIGWSAGEEITQIFNSLNGYFINTYSLFDLTTKLAFELENINIDSTSYKKLKSKNILYGDKKKLKRINIDNTIFDNVKSLKIIEILRHELIHNGSWENTSKIFFQFKGNELIDKWILFPDFFNDSLVSFQNRKRFFSQGNRINEKLPELMNEIIGLLRNTFIEIEKLTTTHNTQ